MPGLASALESKLIKFGAAWLYSDGTTAGNRTAWEAYVTLGNKLADKQGKSSLLALVKVDQDTHHGTAQGGAEAATAGEQQQQQAQQETGAAEGQQAEAGEGGQQQQQKGKKGKQGSVPSGYSLGMLVVLDDDVPRSIMQVSHWQQGLCSREATLHAWCCCTHLSSGDPSFVRVSALQSSPSASCACNCCVLCSGPPQPPESAQVQLKNPV
jgi:hypothetical protein